jgi:hypothetical protein
MAFPNRADYIKFEDIEKNNGSDANKMKCNTIEYVPTNTENENNIENQLKLKNNNVNKNNTFQKITNDDISENSFDFTKSSEGLLSGSMIRDDVNQFGVLQHLTNVNLLENNDGPNDINDVTCTLNANPFFFQENYR